MSVTFTTIRESNDYFHTFEYQNKEMQTLKVSALILQLKVFSIKRVMNKIGMVHKEDFEQIIEKSRSLIGPTYKVGVPEGELNS